MLIAHGDVTSGYSLYVKDGRLVHDMNIGGEHQIVRSDRPVPQPATGGSASHAARVQGHQHAIRC